MTASISLCQPSLTVRMLAKQREHVRISEAARFPVLLVAICTKGQSFSVTDLPGCNVIAPRARRFVLGRDRLAGR